MKDFGSWLHGLGKEIKNKDDLPEGLWKGNDGKIYAQCGACGKDFVCDYVEDVPPDGCDHWCGGSPACCP